MASCYFGNTRESYTSRLNNEIRKFATFGLLRKVNDSITNDVVISYIERKLDGNLASCSCAYPYGLAGAVMCGQASFSEGIKKMTKEYLVNMFWKNFAKCVYGCRYNLGAVECGHGLGKEVKTIRKFPVQILRALDTVRIGSASRLWDAKNAIETLYSVVVPKDSSAPSWRKKDRFGYYTTEYDGFDVPNPRHIRTIGVMRSILSNYLYNAPNRRSIPNDAEKELAIDLAEIMSIMFDDIGFANAYNIRSTYNYAIHQLSKSGPEATFAKRWESTMFDCYSRMISVPQPNEKDGKSLVSIVSLLGHLSPNAALCNQLLRLCGNLSHPWQQESTLNEEFLKSITPVKIPEVVVYIFTELNLQLTKLREAQDLFERYKRGENIGSMVYSCTDEECCDPDYYGHGRVVA